MLTLPWQKPPVYFLFADTGGSAGYILNAPSSTTRIKSCKCLPDIAGLKLAFRLARGLHGGPLDAGSSEAGRRIAQAPSGRRCCIRAARRPPAGCTCCTAIPLSLTHLKS